jgi:hypothetical protein
METPRKLRVTPPIVLTKEEFALSAIQLFRNSIIRIAS